MSMKNMYCLLCWNICVSCTVYIMENVNCPQIVKQEIKLIRQCCVIVQHNCYRNQVSQSSRVLYVKWVSSSVFQSFLNTEPSGWLKKKRRAKYAICHMDPISSLVLLVFFPSFSYSVDLESWVLNAGLNRQELLAVLLLKV